MGDKLQPLVSVIVPAYNAADYLEQTLKSILRQTYSNLEVLVVDDGSTDATAAIAKNFIDKDERFQLIQQENRGVAAARNYGIQVAKGEFIAPIDADDIWHEENIGKQVKKMLEPENNAVGMVFSWSADIDQANLLTSNIRALPYHGNIFPIMLVKNVVGNASASMIRRSCLDDIGTYNTDFLSQQAQGCEDWDLYLRIAEKYQVALVPELLVGYRQVIGSMSQNVDDMNRSRALALAPINKKYPHVYSAVMQWFNAADTLQLGKKYYIEGCNQQAWDAVLKACQTDWAMTLCTLKSYSLVSKLLWRSVCHRFMEQQSLQKHTMQTMPAPCASNRRWLVKRYITVFLLLLFPDNLLLSLRIRWIHSQVCPEHRLPQSISLKTIIGARLSAVNKGCRDFCEICSHTACKTSNKKAVHKWSDL